MLGMLGLRGLWDVQERSRGGWDTQPQRSLACRRAAMCTCHLACGSPRIKLPTTDRPICGAVCNSPDCSHRSGTVQGGGQPGKVAKDQILQNEDSQVRGGKLGRSHQRGEKGKANTDPNTKDRNFMWMTFL